MSLLESTIDSRTNPLAVVEDIAADNNWAFERSGEDEVTIVSKGDWTDYQLSFTWMGEIEALHLACAFDMKIPQARKAEVQRLIAAINEQLSGRADRVRCAMREHAGRRHPRLRAILPRVPVRGLGRQVGPGGHERGDVRYRG